MATMDLEIAGYQVPRKSIVLLSPYTMHRSPKYWPEPDRFHPERWETEDPGRPKFAYYPFGGGPRLCIGERFAWMEGVIILAAAATLPYRSTASRASKASGTCARRLHAGRACC